MIAMTTTLPDSVRIPANYAVTRRLGRWTTARRFEVRSHWGRAVLDLRSPEIPAGDIEIHVDLDRSTLILLVPDGAVVDDWDLRRTGRSRVKDYQAPKAAGSRRIVLTGQVRQGEVRVRRGGVAILSAMFTREYVADVRRAHKEGGHPTVDDPTRTA
jgi:hypothetical protein